MRKKYKFTDAQRKGLVNMAKFYNTHFDIRFYGTGFNANGASILDWISMVSEESGYSDGDRGVLTDLRELYLRNRNITDVTDMITTL